MKNKIFTVIVCTLLTVNVQAQFLPGDVGYKISMQQPYAKMKVQTQLRTISSEFGYTTPYALSTFTENGWLAETVYLQDSSLAEDERSPEMKDVYNYYTDGRIRVLSLNGYDLYPIEYGFEYNKKGKLIASVIASAEAREYTYEYNSAGNIITRKGKGGRWTYADENDTEGKLTMVDLEVNDYTWDKKGNLISDNFYYSGEWANKALYHYNDQQQLVSSEIYYDNSLDAKPSFSSEYSYDTNGLLTKMVTTDAEFIDTTYFTYTYK